MKGDHTYGIVSITDDELAARFAEATRLLKPPLTSRESRTSSVGSRREGFPRKRAYANVARLLADVDADSIDEGWLPALVTSSTISAMLALISLSYSRTMFAPWRPIDGADIGDYRANR